MLLSCVVWHKYVETLNENDESVQKTLNVTEINVPKYCIVNSNNVLWTCHKACNIEFGDCDYSICSKCYSSKMADTSKNRNVNMRPSSKRRRLVQSIDDDHTICRHGIGSLVPFMDKSFFTVKYKDTIRSNRYVLPMNCSECEAILVDKKPTITSKLNVNLITEV